MSIEMEECPRCRGAGGTAFTCRRYGDDFDDCSRCDGAGEVSVEVEEQEATP